MYVTLYETDKIYHYEEDGYWIETRRPVQSFRFNSLRLAKCMLIREARRLGLKVCQNKKIAFTNKAVGENTYIYVENKKGRNERRDRPYYY